MTGIDLSDCVDMLAQDELVRVRTDADQTVNGTGLIVPGATSEFEFLGQFTPATGDDLQRLSEGQRAPGTMRLITTTDIRTALTDPNSSSSRRRADLIRSKATGRTYEVADLARWSVDGKFYDAVCTEVRR